MLKPAVVLKTLVPLRLMQFCETHGIIRCSWHEFRPFPVVYVPNRCSCTAARVFLKPASFQFVLLAAREHGLFDGTGTQAERISTFRDCCDGRHLPPGAITTAKPSLESRATFVHAALRSEVKPVERVRMHFFFDKLPPELKKEVGETAKRVAENALEQRGINLKATVRTLYADSDGKVSASESRMVDEVLRPFESSMGEKHDHSSSTHWEGANSKGQTSSKTSTSQSSDGKTNSTRTECSGSFNFTR